MILKRYSQRRSRVIRNSCKVSLAMTMVQKSIRQWFSIVCSPSQQSFQQIDEGTVEMLRKTFKHNRGTQRLFSVKYSFEEENIA